jgi:cytochrome b561
MAVHVFPVGNLRLEQMDMTERIESTRESAEKAVAESGRFDQISISLHWITVLLIVTQFTSAWFHKSLDPDTSLAAAVLATHRNTGVVIWFVGLARLVWRRNFAYLPPFPQSMSKLQQTISTAVEYGLYILLFVQPIIGLARVLLRGESFDFLFWEVPALMEPDPTLRGQFADVHEFGAKALLVLIGFHAGAAIVHRFVLRDGVLQRMLPWTSKESSGART